MKILHIDSSIQGEGSVSRSLSAAAVETLAAQHPEAEIEYRDLAAEPLDHLTFQNIATAEAKAVLEQFKAADIVVIGAAFYNFSVASQLKSWIDRLAVAGETFRYGPNGAEGLMGGKQVVVALARGGLYGEGTAQRSFEHAETWLRSVLSFIGIDDPRFVIAEGVAMGPEPRAQAVADAMAEARALDAVSDRKAA